MSVDVLFPPGCGVDRDDTLWRCARCYSVVRVLDINKHTAWHAAVDTATTTALPGSSKRPAGEPCDHCATRYDHCRESTRNNQGRCCHTCVLAPGAEDCHGGLI